MTDSHDMGSEVFTGPGYSVDYSEGRGQVLQEKLARLRERGVSFLDLSESQKAEIQAANEAKRVQ